jgi:hypothetical protein
MGPRDDVVWLLSMCRLRDGVWTHDPVHRDVVLASPIGQRIVDHPVRSWGLCAVSIVREPKH